MKYDTQTLMRLLAAAAAAVCVASLLIAYFYMEKYLLLAPCPLCILDRIVVAVMAVIFIVQAAAPNFIRRTLWSINAVVLFCGFIFAIRHIWLQAQPLSNTGCLADIEVAKSFMHLIAKAFDAKGDCGAIYWEFLRLTIPEQVLLLFVGFAAILFIQARWIFASQISKDEDNNERDLNQQTIS